MGGSYSIVLFVKFIVLLAKIILQLNKKAVTLMPYQQR